jgi:SAM-dependent methyltransferase
MEAQRCQTHGLARHFVQPRGLLGWLAGQIMAHRKSNQQRNRWTLEQLAIEPHHRILELGCGPGWALSVACEAAHEGFVVGVDRSRTMLAQARKRNRSTIKLGRLKLVEASAEDLPGDLGGPFDRVYSSNVFGFLDAPEPVFKTLYVHMRPGGLLATTWLPRLGPRTQEASVEMAQQIEEVCERVGFTFRSREQMQINAVPAICVIVARPSRIV